MQKKKTKKAKQKNPVQRMAMFVGSTYSDLIETNTTVNKFNLTQRVKVKEETNKQKKTLTKAFLSIFTQSH